MAATRMALSGLPSEGLIFSFISVCNSKVLRFWIPAGICLTRGQYERLLCRAFREPGASSFDCQYNSTFLETISELLQESDLPLEIRDSLPNFHNPDP